MEGRLSSTMNGVELNLSLLEGLVFIIRVPGLDDGSLVVKSSGESW